MNALSSGSIEYMLATEPASRTPLTWVGSAGLGLLLVLIIGATAAVVRSGETPAKDATPPKPSAAVETPTANKQAADKQPPEKPASEKAVVDLAEKRAAAGVPVSYGDFPTAEGETRAAPIPNRLPLIARLGIYADPRVLPHEGVGGGPYGDGARDVGGGGTHADFWWTVAITNRQTLKYLSETGITMAVIDDGEAPRIWRASSTTPDQPCVDLPLGHWYTLEIEFRDNGQDGHLGATHRVYGPGQKLLYENVQGGLAGYPESALVGDIYYSWITLIDKQFERLFVWTDPRHYISPDKVEIVNVAELTTDPTSGGPAQWEAMKSGTAAVAAAYRLGPRDVLRRILPPYPARRDEVVRKLFTNGPEKGNLYLIMHLDGLGPHLEGPGKGLALQATVADLVAMAVGDAKVEIKGDADVLKRPIRGDFVVRRDCKPQAALDELVRILAADLIPVKLTYSRSGPKSHVQMTRQ